MKNSILFLLFLATTLTTSTLFTACNTSAEKADKAQDKVQAAKQDLLDAEKKSAEAAQKAAYAEEWRILKAESETTIKDNETQIATLKSKMKKTTKSVDVAYNKSIDDLEARNTAMRNRISNYDNSNWESFKREFNHDMQELGAAFKDLTVNNKK
jgi:hypothetical protein